MTQRDWWDYAVIIANIASAIGTLAAVWAALYLAREGNRPRLRISVDVREVLNVVPPIRRDEAFVMIEIVNTGPRTLVVSTIGWRVGRLFRRRFFQVPPVNELSGTIPATLEPAHAVRCAIPLPIFQEGARVFQPRADAGWLRRWDARYFRAQVHLSTGERFSVRPHPHVDRVRAGTAAADLTAG